MTYDAKYAGATIFRQEFTRDEAGRIVTKTETIQGVTTAYEYAYDPAGRLHEVKTNGVVSATYTYDTNGNRLSKITPTATEVGTYDDQDRLLTYRGATYTYTDNGDVKTKTDASGPTAYDYDALGNLRRVDLPDGRVIEYVIDGQNRRVGKKVNGVLSRAWIFDDQLSVVAELDGSGNVNSRFDHGMTTIEGTLYRVVSDHLGTPRIVVEPHTGVVLRRLDVDEFGVTQIDTNPTVIPIGFAGGLVDSDSGLIRFGFRDFDSVSARWTSKDPMRFRSGDLNVYGYTFGDPINWTDPTGMYGKPMPPEGPSIPVPGDPSNSWKWNPNPKSPRGGSWGPKTPIKGQSQPKASWDNNAPVDHWDVDDGLGNRRRHDENGNEISDEEAHGETTCSTPDLTWDWKTIGQAVGLGVAGLAITLLTGGGTLQPSPAGLVIVHQNPEIGIDSGGRLVCPDCSI
jgi:RHS repeat-associated protein